MAERVKCQAEIHHSKCNGFANNIDHFTPRCIGKLFGLSEEEIDQKVNLVPMNRYCHRLKDRSTPHRKVLLADQQGGKELSLAEYRLWRDEHDRKFYKPPMH